MFYIDNIDTITRYDEIKFFNFNRDNTDPLDSFMAINIPKLPEQGSYIITNEELRPDRLSYNLYGDTQYWWIILLYNNILDINNLKTGVVIRYPSLGNIEMLYEQASLTKKVM